MKNNQKPNKKNAPTDKTKTLPSSTRADRTQQCWKKIKPNNLAKLHQRYLRITLNQQL